jgi:AGZA family xanthine/uracil permease-like MFS transporter
MAFAANYPIAIAPGMGLNAYFASVVTVQGISYRTVFGAVFIAGILFLLLSLTNIREILIGAIPDSLKHGITSGIGLFIAFIGLKMSGIITASPSTLVALGDLRKPVTALTVAALLITLGLIAGRIHGAMFAGMAITALIGYFLRLLSFKGIVALPPAPVFFDIDVAGVFDRQLYVIVFVFLLVMLFDTTGTLLGIGEQAGLIKDGKLPRAKSALMADALAATVGAVFGTSPSTAYIESSAGVAAGGRTGLTALTVAVLAMLSIFFSPAISAISSLPAITSPVLIIVGSFMMEGLSKVKWGEIDESFPTFITMISMPLTSSIATGIAAGFIIYPLLKLLRGSRTM